MGAAEKTLRRLDQGIGGAHTKPGAFLDDMKRAARDLPPEHLPWFWDTVGHRLCRDVPRHAAKAYSLARGAERDHGLPVWADYLVGNALLFARAGALGGSEVSGHQKQLAAHLPGERAHEEFAVLLRECGAAGVVPPADLHSRVRASAKGAGLGAGEQARLLGEVLTAAGGSAVPGALLDGAARVFAKSPPDYGVLTALAELFPPVGTVGGAYLRLLRDSRTVEAMAGGWVAPSGGIAAWLDRFVYTYTYSLVRVQPRTRSLIRGRYRQAMPDELYADVLPLLAGRLRGQGTPLQLGDRVDADLVDACLALEIPVEKPHGRVRLETHGCGRDFAALAAHPDWRHLLAGAAQPAKRGTAITRLPETAGVDTAVHQRISQLLDRAAGGGLDSAGEALDRLDSLLDTPTSAALEGIDEALAGLDLSGPLLRTLRADTSAETGLPAPDDSAAESDGGGARGLREVSPEAAQVLLDTARSAPAGAAAAEVHAAAVRVLPGAIDPGALQGVVAAAEQAARLRDRAEALSRRTATVRSGALVHPQETVPDSALVPALRGLLPISRPFTPSEQPATVTALAADGQYLRGAVGDDVRRISLPDTPQDWTFLLGAIDAVAWRAVCGFTGGEDRAALKALLGTWAEHPCAEPGEWRVGRADGAALAPLCERGGTVVPGVPGTEVLDPRTQYRFLQPADAPVPDGAKDTGTVAVARDDAGRLRRLLGLLAERGPLPLVEAAIAAFQERTGVRRAVAALVLAGMPRRANHGSDYTNNFEAHQRMLRAKPFQASKLVAREAEGLSSRLDAAGRLRVLAAAVPDDPAELWAEGGAAAAARRMAEVWVELLGGRTAVDEDTAEALENDLGSGYPQALALADPGTSGIATRDMRCVLAGGKYGPVELYEAATDGSRKRLFGFKGSPYAGLASLLAWALTERPAGSPATAGVPELFARLRARLDAPELLLPLGRHRLPGDLERVFGPRTHPVEPPSAPRSERAAHPVAYDTGLVVVDGKRASSHPLLRPCALADPGTVEHTAEICRNHGLHGLLRDIDRLRVYYDGGLARMVERAADTPVPPGGYEANPLLSVPDLVKQAAAESGTGTDAAALHLQLLTLARPTDRNVRTWNGWTPSYHKKVQAELLDRGLVVQDKRSRAGRSVFLPGAWTVLKAPELPLETAKLDTHMAAVTDTKEIEGPFTRLLPPAPLHEMFAAAWAAR
ncbi:hypothetical protein GCM10027570_28940 [Streptomonospora sediminis]